MSLEEHFDATFATALALKEKQVQQSYRPIIGIHKWFARRPGTVFRCLLLAEFNSREALDKSYWRGHRLKGVIADPFMGGGTPIYEANRLGFHVVGTDINPMAYWVVRQALAPLDPRVLASAAHDVIRDVEAQIGDGYATTCTLCGGRAQVKYFLWVKVASCPACACENDLFPGYLLAEAERHPRHVLLCAICGELSEHDVAPSAAKPQPCTACGADVQIEGPARRQRIACKACHVEFAYSGRAPQAGPPRHRLWAIEYHCAACKPTHVGRFFKRPDEADKQRVERASKRLLETPGLPIPADPIPAGDETDRLHRWGYTHYREMFNERQLLGLGLLLQRILDVPESEARHALLTVFSDSLRYQNMLCRYDTYALKCQDIFSVHGFPVGLVQCENNLLGIPRVGSGSFRHFVEKYMRAKAYCRAPFETVNARGPKTTVQVRGESIEARFTDRFPSGDVREALLRAQPAATLELPAYCLDGVFTDPPYFDNVQYAELMDFCFAWLRIGLRGEFDEFHAATTRNLSELTGNATLGRGLEDFTRGLSAVFSHYAAALKPSAPFVFTYHHNSAAAYTPLVVAMLDAGLDCSATLPVAAEMSASLHIAGTGSSVLDSVFVCRLAASGPARPAPSGPEYEIAAALAEDARAMQAAGVRVGRGDLRCLAAGHMARLAAATLGTDWDPAADLTLRMQRASDELTRLAAALDLDVVIARLLEVEPSPVVLYERFLGRPFASYRDAASGLVGDVMEAAIEERLRRARVSFRKTGKAERIPGLHKPQTSWCPPSSRRPW